MTPAITNISNMLIHMLGTLSPISNKKPIIIRINEIINILITALNDSFFISFINISTLIYSKPKFKFTIL